jgi:Cu/Ag efflux protein CusF
MLNQLAAIAALALALGTQPPPDGADAPKTVAQAQSDKAPSAEKKGAGKGAVEAVSLRGSVAAVDKDKGTVTLKGPRGRTVTLQVKDRSKLETIKVGDPVVATYMEALVLQVEKAGSATPSVTVQESRVASKPGEAPAGAVAQEVTATAAITAIDKQGRTVTIKGPQGNTETIKAKDPKHLDGIKVGDMVEITYARARVVALDKPASK